MLTNADWRLPDRSTTTLAGHVSGYRPSRRASARTRIRAASDRSVGVANGGVREKSVRRSGAKSASAIWYWMPAIECIRFEGQDGRSMILACAEGTLTVIAVMPLVL